MKIEKCGNCASCLGGEHDFENCIFAANGICDELKIAENRNCASCLGGEHDFEKCIFDLHFHCIIMKIAENRNCASCLGGEHDFENVRKVSWSIWNEFFAFRSASAERNENHQNQVDGRFGVAGRNAQGRWGEI